MKLSNIHLLVIVLLSVFVGGWGILGIKEAYENIEKPKHVLEPKYQPVLQAMLKGEMPHKV